MQYHMNNTNININTSIHSIDTNIKVKEKASLIEMENGMDVGQRVQTFNGQKNKF